MDPHPEEEEIDVFRNVGQGLVGPYREITIQYWQELINEIEMTNEPGSPHQDDFKSHSLPLARIKKVMKTDEDVRMISAEAPILFAKACEIFITELTMRAWCIAEEHKRRTLQKSDIAQALLKSDMFDFLIDIVPRNIE
ncbi:Histone domain-containing protein [Lachancea thermotolerans]|uniref:KLTH0D01100p n=2 Tax=Lachancea TaxID=300275 RepID=C5DFZ2_LACTC|nr:KLTH0D01100p [Lachancea thermotolerans CBS 6340]CAR22334.1 KLTH0D01100p [Lachancea thermotolerans CBS 6340]CUS20834.1 LAQU0S01e15676g1_1 [Lachancea quebecensis]